MQSKKSAHTIERFEKLSALLRGEQFRLLDAASRHHVLPGKSVLKLIAELELNIVAVENSITELKNSIT
ncbi:hypothetical protein [Brucella intermedia]|uniref:hypothetical protein n=1 Tax=Brucella intermedia TaxID=94625 RepID=UPI00046992C8|nr:hypothetical protein [Brucella intermedia]